MALHCISDDCDTDPIATKRAVGRKRPTLSGFLFHRPVAWPTALASPTTSLPWVCSPAEPSSLDDFSVSSSSGAGTTQDHPYLSTDSLFSTCLDQPIHPISSARCSTIWPIVDLADCQSHASRCLSTLSAGQDSSSVVEDPIDISGNLKKPKRDVQNTRVDKVLGSAKGGLDTFRCQHCEKSFATRSTLRHHEIVHDPVRAHKYHCTTCKRGFRYPKDLKRHSTTHRQVDEPGGYSCTLCPKTFSRRDNLRRHERSHSHSQTSKPTDAIDDADAPGGLRHAEKGHADTLGRPAYDCDQEHQHQSLAGSNVTSAMTATDSHNPLPIRSSAKKPSTKRIRNSPSDDEEDPSGDGPDRKKSRKPMCLLCPFIGCHEICEGPISVLLRHIWKKHRVRVCIDCLKQTAVHQELACQKICASPDCRYKTGEYHVSTRNCVDQRHDEVTTIKYGLVCETLGLAKKSFVSNSKQHCSGCQARDEFNATLNSDSQAKEATIAKLTSDCQAKDATISTLYDIINQLISPRQTFSSPPNIAGQSGFMSGAYAPPILPGYQFDLYDQGPPLPMNGPMQSLSSAPSSNVRQATQPGSSTQPSLRPTTLTYMSQPETQTETTETVPESDMDPSTPKPSDMDEFLNEDYDPPALSGNAFLHGLGDHFKGR